MQGTDPFIGGPSLAQILAALQELVQATNAQAEVINGSLGKPASGDLSGIYPGPINVVSTHLNAPLGVVQGGTGLAGGSAGGLLYFVTPGLLAASSALTEFAILLGGGPGAAPAALGSLGTANTLLHGNAAGAPTYGPVATADISNAAVTYAKIQNETGLTLLGNPNAPSLPPSEITLGATLDFSGSALETKAITGDVTASANSFATTVAQINGAPLGSTTPTAGNVLIGSGTQWVSHAISGDATLSPTGVLSITGAAGSVSLGINAAGTTQGTATQLTAQHNEVTVVGSGTGVIMATTIGVPQVVVNRGLNTLNIYPPVGAEIDNAGVNTAVTLLSQSRLTVTMYSATQAYVEA